MAVVFEGEAKCNRQLQLHMQADGMELINRKTSRTGSHVAKLSGERYLVFMLATDHVQPLQ